MSTGISTAVLDVQGLSVAYRPRGRGPLRPAVEGLDLRVRAGETVAIVGESGSGKSTTAAAVLGLLPREGVVTAGSVQVGGRDVIGVPERSLRQIRGRLAGLIPQDPTVSLNPTMRIGPQVAEAVGRRLDADRRLTDARVLEVLADAGLDEPELRARQYPHELSGGMRQRVLIAIALAARPALIIADEPTSALDVTVQKRILDHLGQLSRDRGIALLIITHDLAVAADRADRVLVMQGGRVVEEGTPDAILLTPRAEYTRALTAAAPGLARDPQRVQPVATGTPSDSVLGASSGSVPVADILRIDHVTKDFALPRSAGSGGRTARTVRALDDVSLAVPAGQTLGVVGESGSGKTTALRIALGLTPPTAGRVHFDGEDITDHNWRRLRPLRQRFQLVHQNPFSSLDPKFTVQQTITEPLVSFGVGDRSLRAARARELLDQVGLPASFLDRRPAHLSGGQRQRVAIARALALTPELIFLDEPVSALDASVQDQILRLLGDLQRELGVSYFFISHDLAVVAQISHRVAVLKQGQVVEQGSTAEIFDHPAQEYTRDLLRAIPGRQRTLVLSGSVPAGSVPAGSAQAGEQS